MTHIKFGAVIVTYNPKLDRFEKVLLSIVDQIDFIVVIDNNSKNINEIKQICKGYSNIENIFNDKNYGLGKGLNIGVEKLKNKVDWLLTLDQDSIVLGDIKEIIGKIDSNLKNIGIIELNDKEKVNKNFFINFKPNQSKISGSVVNSKIFSNNIKYREEFFVDQIDYDFDYEVKKNGFVILKTTKKLLDHQWGKIIKMKNGKVTIIEPEWRVYLIIRNSFKLLIERKINLIFFILQAKGLNYLLIKAFGFKEFKNIIKIDFLGIKDAINNKLGPPKEFL